MNELYMSGLNVILHIMISSNVIVGLNMLHSLMKYVIVWDMGYCLIIGIQSHRKTKSTTKLTIGVKIWPCPRWRHVSLTFQLSEEYQSSSLKSMLYWTYLRSSPFRDYPRSEDFKPSSSSNRSFLISADSYAALSSSTFITCNTPHDR